MPSINTPSGDGPLNYANPAVHFLLEDPRYINRLDSCQCVALLLAVMLTSLSPGITSVALLSIRSDVSMSLRYISIL